MQPESGSQDQQPQSAPQQVPQTGYYQPQQPAGYAPQSHESVQPQGAPAVIDQAPVRPEPTSPLENVQEADQVAVQWQAPEYIQTPRNPLWYVGFWVVVIILMLVAALVIQSWSFAVLIPAMAVALTIYSHRPPRYFSYALSNRGLYINDQLHPMTEFRAFGVTQTESLPSLVLIPIKRFRPGITVYFPAEYGEGIVDLFGSRIPMEEIEPDAFDKIVRKLRI